MTHDKQSHKGPPRSAAKERFWRRQLAQFSKSLLSIRAYCSKHSLSEPSFYAWRRELAQRDRKAAASLRRDSNAAQRTARFLPLVLEGGTELSPPSCALEVVLASGERLKVTHDCPPATLSTVLVALREVRGC